MSSSQSRTQVKRGIEEEEFEKFRFILFEGDLRILKEELIHIHYKLFIKLLRTHIAKLAKNEIEMGSFKVRFSLKILRKSSEEFYFIKGILSIFLHTLKKFNI